MRCEKEDNGLYSCKFFSKQSLFTYSIKAYKVQRTPNQRWKFLLYSSAAAGEPIPTEPKRVIYLFQFIDRKEQETDVTYHCRVLAYLHRAIDHQISFAALNLKDAIEQDVEHIVHAYNQLRLFIVLMGGNDD